MPTLHTFPPPPLRPQSTSRPTPPPSETRTMDGHFARPTDGSSPGFSAGLTNGHAHGRAADAGPSAGLGGRSTSLQSNLSRMSIEDDEPDAGRGAAYPRSDEGEESDADTAESDDDEGLIDVHVEVRLSPSSLRQPHQIRALVPAFVADNFGSVQLGTRVADDKLDEVYMFRGAIEEMRFAQRDDGVTYVPVSRARFLVHVYRNTADNESTFSIGRDEDESEAEVAAAAVTELPCAKFNGLWDNLIYGDDIKPYLLSFVRSTLVLSEAESDPDVISCNRVILLHGPPGTGKTSLCRAISQKTAIRLSDKYPRGKLVEINSHSLFSKWFSESGKLVQKLFSTIGDMADDDGCFVVVMIDEVESLTAARAGAMNGNEPTDALRVVNALLTQLDKLKARKNVLVVATSNMAHGIDSAFISRADIVRHVPNPAPQAVYWILASTLDELARTGLLRARGRTAGICDWADVAALRAGGLDALEAGAGGGKDGARRLRRARASVRLAEIAETCYTNAVSARTLRRLPVLALAKHVAEGATLARWVDAYAAALGAQLEDHAKVGASAGADGAGKCKAELGMGALVKTKVERA